MKNNKNFNLVEKYSEKEFKDIIELIPHSKLVKLIKKNDTKFQSDIKGYRPDALPLKKLQHIYYTKIYKNGDKSIEKYIEICLCECLKELDKKISESIGSPKTVFDKIKKNDMDCFEKLIILLLENKYEGKLFLYFKMIGYKLADKQIGYLNSDFMQKIELKKLKVLYEKRYVEQKNKLISIEDEIKCLKQKNQDDKKYFEFELSNKSSKINELNEKYNKISLEVQDYSNKLDNLKLLFENYKKKDIDNNIKLNKLGDLLNNQCDEFINKECIINNNKLVQEMKNIKVNIDDLKLDKDMFVKEINSLNEKKRDLENKIGLINNTSGKFKDNIQEFCSILQYKKNDMNSVSELYTIESINHQEKIEEVIDAEDFIENLKINLSRSGIKNDYVLDLAQYIYAVFANKMNLLLIGYNARKISNAISYIISGSSAEIITLPLGYNDCNKLISTVKNSNSRVILIENAVENISECVYIPLLKENLDKYIIFSAESSENISIFPKSILNYMMIIDVDMLLSYESNNDLVYSITNKDIFNTNVEAKYVSNNLRHINELIDVMELNNAFKFKIAEVMSIIDELSPNAMYDILLFSIGILCKGYDKIDSLMDFIRKQKINSVTLEILKSVFGGNLHEG